MEMKSYIIQIITQFVFFFSFFGQVNLRWGFFDISKKEPKRMGVKKQIRFEHSFAGLGPRFHLMEEEIQRCTHANKRT